MNLLTVILVIIGVLVFALVAKILIQFINVIWGILGAFALVFLIVGLYRIGTTPELIKEDNIAKNSMMVIDCKTGIIEYTTIENGKAVKHKPFKAPEKNLNVDFMNKFKYVVLKDVIMNEYIGAITDTFKCNEIYFLEDGYRFESNKGDEKGEHHAFKWRENPVYEKPHDPFSQGK